MAERFPHAAPRGYEMRVVVASFRHPWEAELGRSRLAAAGISAVLADENLVRLHWLVSQAVGGVKLLVAESEAERASSVLAERVELPEIGLATAADDEPARRCPRCLSGNLSFERFAREGFVGGLLTLGFPLPIPRPRWRCGHCGGSWRNAEVTPPESG